LKKINAVTVNGMVMSLAEVADGSAESMIKQIESELSNIRDIATALKMERLIGPSLLHLLRTPHLHKRNSTIRLK